MAAVSPKVKLHSTAQIIKTEGRLIKMKRSLIVAIRIFFTYWGAALLTVALQLVIEPSDTFAHERHNFSSEES